MKRTFGVTSEDDFFATARPAMARFKKDEAVAKHREFAEDVLTRNGFPLRQGVFELHEHNELLSYEQVHTLITRFRGAKSDELLNGLTEKDRWAVSQYLLLLAFPSLKILETEPKRSEDF